MKISIEKSKTINQQIIEFRRYFHKYPEISNMEFNTAKKIKEILQKLDIKYIDNVYGNGIIATLGKETGKKIGFRADMDALQIEEKNNFEYKSQNQGVMHACGHDGHMAILLGTALLLKEVENELEGEIRLIFQPAEENSPIGGSRGMLDSGYLDDLDAIYGLHLWPFIKKGTFGIKSGAIMAASDHFSIEIQGQSSHAAKPHSGVDSIVVASQIINQIQSIVSRKVDPLESAVVTIGNIIGGTRYNIIAEKCFLEGTVRTFKESTRLLIENTLKDIVKYNGKINKINCLLNYERGYSEVINDEYYTNFIKNVAIEIFGKDVIDDNPESTMIGEDFSFYLKNLKGAFIWFGVEGNKQPLHSDRFDLDEENLWMGSLLFANTGIEFLKE